MIDGGPSRTSRSAGRASAQRVSTPRARVEEEPARLSQADVPMTEPLPRSAYMAASETKKGIPTWVAWLGGLLMGVAIMAAVWLLWPGDASLKSTIDSERYQAVFLSNGQVYFGNLTELDGKYLQLTNVYYLERQLTAGDSEDAAEGDTATEPAVDDNNFQLLKYSDVLYGSEDKMVIAKDSILRYENLRPDGVVAKAIANRN